MTLQYVLIKIFSDMRVVRRRSLWSGSLGEEVCALSRNHSLPMADGRGDEKRGRDEDCQPRTEGERGSLLTKRCAAARRRTSCLAAAIGSDPPPQMTIQVTPNQRASGDSRFRGTRARAQYPIIRHSQRDLGTIGIDSSVVLGADVLVARSKCGTAPLRRLIGA